CCAVGVETQAGRTEGHAGNKGRRGGSANRGASRRSAEVETCVFTGDDVERPTGRVLDNGGNSEIGDHMLEEAISGLGTGRLEDGTVHPAVALVVHGIRALEIEEAAVLRLQGGLQVGGVVNGMGPGVAGKQLEAKRGSLGEVTGQSVVPELGNKALRVDADERNRTAKPPQAASQRRQSDLRCVHDVERLSPRNASRSGDSGWLPQ